MYQVDDTVLYGVYGVCRIVEITKKDIGGKAAPYYVLEPVYNDLSTIFVPVNNELLTSKMRELISEKEIFELIHSLPSQELIWIENEPERKERYKCILNEGDRKELIRLIKTLHIYRDKQKEIGKKLHVADETFLKEAEKMLHKEFAYVLGIKTDEVAPFILEQLNIAK